MQPSQPVPLEDLGRPPYRDVLCYPRPDDASLRERLKELRGLGVLGLEFVGRSQIGSLHVLGKGCVGLVLLARTEDGKAALKARRVDANRRDMSHEVEMLKLANQVKVGPRLKGHTTNFLLMEFIDGAPLPTWASAVAAQGGGERLKVTLRTLLRQCHTLDEASIDHGELSRATKHVIIDWEDKPCIIDFETASRNRRVKNLSSIVQYLFEGSEVSAEIGKLLGPIDHAAVRKLLAEYKSTPRDDLFRDVLRGCNL